MLCWYIVIAIGTLAVILADKVGIEDASVTAIGEELVVTIVALLVITDVTVRPIATPICTLAKTVHADSILKPLVVITFNKTFPASWAVDAVPTTTACAWVVWIEVRERCFDRLVHTEFPHEPLVEIVTLVISEVVGGSHKVNIGRFVFYGSVVKHLASLESGVGV